MSDPNNTEDEGSTNFLDMSDEDMMKFDPSTLVADTATEVDEDTTDPVDDPVDEVTSDKEDAEDAADDAGDAEGEAQNESSTDDESDGEPEAKEAEPATEIDYKAAYGKIFKPFKANGKDITVANEEDAIALMKMGANYNLKMGAMKPHLKMLKMLENNGLLSEERLSFLIDLDKKDPAAISKLISDSKLDPLDLDAGKASEYKKTTYSVDDREMELDTVLEELKSTPSYTRTLDVVSNKWDAPSKQAIANTPQLLTQINNHIASGIYDTVMAEVDRERMFGRLSNLSDLEAYSQVGDALNAKGAFATVPNGTAPQPRVNKTTAPAKPVVNEAALRDKRRAAGSTKSAGSSAPAQAFNVLSMSDEDFSKQALPRFA